MSKSYHAWSSDEIALMLYGRYKGLNNKQLSELLKISYSGTCNMVSRYNHPEGESARIQQMFNKAGAYELQVRGGNYPEIREYWDRRIGEINGIKYNYPAQDPINWKDVEKNSVEVAVPPTDPEKPLFRVEVYGDPQVVANLLEILQHIKAF